MCHFPASEEKSVRLAWLTDIHLNFITAGSAATMAFDVLDANGFTAASQPNWGNKTTLCPTLGLTSSVLVERPLRVLEVLSVSGYIRGQRPAARVKGH